MEYCNRHRVFAHWVRRFGVAVEKCIWIFRNRVGNVRGYDVVERMLGGYSVK
jgi:hypothetical protein